MKTKKKFPKGTVLNKLNPHNPGPLFYNLGNIGKWAEGSNQPPKGRKRKAVA